MDFGNTTISRHLFLLILLMLLLIDVAVVEVVFVVG